MTERLDRRPKEIVGPMTGPKLILGLLYLRDDWEKNEGAREYSRNDGHAQWFLALVANLENAMMARILPDSANNCVSEFIKWWVEEYPKKHEGNPIVDNPEEIEKGREVIYHVLDSFRPSREEYGAFTKEVLFNRLLLFKDGWFDEIPDRIVHSTDGPWKIRTGWLLGVASDLENALHEGLLPHNTENDVKDFLKWWKKDYPKDRNHQVVFLPEYGKVMINTRKDIEKGNGIINKVLESLEVSSKEN